MYFYSLKLFFFLQHVLKYIQLKINLYTHNSKLKLKIIIFLSSPLNLPCLSTSAEIGGAV